MKRTLFCLILAATAGCAQSPSTDSTAGAQSQDLQARTPAPFALQFVDRFSAADSNTLGLTDVELRRDGTYTASFDDGSHESGVYLAAATTHLPLSFTFITRGHGWTATVDSYASTTSRSTLNVSIDGIDVALAPSDAVGPSESLCDASGGSWTDDDPEPTTGLFCLCPASRVYIPSQGGCVP